MSTANPETLPQIPLYASKLGLVSVPQVTSDLVEEPGFERLEAVALLQTLGMNLGMNVLLRGACDVEIPAFGDEAVRKVIEGFDVVWFKGPELVAVFVVSNESRTEGVRQLADLLALGPKTKSAFYVVSVPELQPELLAEIHRPLYRLLKKNLTETIRLLDWSRLQAEVTQLGERVRYLKAEFLEGISEFPVA